MDLKLAVKGIYFDAIKSGEKVEEFRVCSDYWRKRIVGRKYDALIITRGYPKKDDPEKTITLVYKGYEVKTITHPHFGNDPVNVFAIKANYENRVLPTNPNDMFGA